jgi:hypothetical protein
MRQTPLKRRAPLRRNPKSKGTRGEKEIRDLLREEWGYVKANRNLGSGAQGGGDIIEAIPGVNIEVKRVEKLNIWKALNQSELAASPTDIPAVFFRRNRSTWYAALPLSDFLGLVQASQL